MERCDWRFMKNLFRKCGGKLKLKRFPCSKIIEEAKWIDAVLYCTKCDGVHDLLKEEELTEEELLRLSSSTKKSKVVKG